MKCVAISFLITAFVSSSVYSQEYSYTHYDISEGLAGTTAYCITQDADGFIWIGTETGVSRFDGTHFKNFTTGDGLTDIEVLQIFGDSKGRVWMAPFKKSVCYYYHGKIHNPENDTLLSRIRLKGNIEGFAEDAFGNVLIEERVGLHLVSADGKLRNIDTIGGLPINSCTSICRSAGGHFLVQEKNQIWNFSDSFTLFRSIPIANYSPVLIAMNAKGVVWREDVLNSDYESFDSNKRIYRPVANVFHFVHVSYSLPGDGFIYFNESEGVTQLDPVSGKQRIFLPGLQVSKSYRDRDGNLWFTTLNHGIYRLNSDEFRTQLLGFTAKQGAASALSFLRLGKELWVGTDHNQVFKLGMPEFNVLDTVKFMPEGKEKVYFIDTAGKGFIFCTGYGVLWISSRLQFAGSDVIGTKWVRKLNGDELLVGSATGVMIYSRRVSWITDTLWRERSTTGFTDGKVIYFGTMNGLYKVNPDRSVVFMGQRIPFFRKRISSIALAADGTLWVASFDDAGIVGFRGDTITTVITRSQGLTSDICRTLLIRDDVLWVGTDKGLNAIRLDRPGYPITRYTSDDGLGSDMINSLFADDSAIFAGTSNGLSMFNYHRVQTGEQCGLRLLAINNAGKDRLGDTANLSLSYHAKDIRLEFVGISYRSAGNIQYRYRMLGLDSNWRQTNATLLDYPSLPSGSYTFQLQAVNKFGIPSNRIELPFRVEAPFWETTWFRVLAFAAMVAATWLLVGWRIRYIRRRQHEREELVKQLAEMENRALQAQMNPHFIFNCLNSIQQFMFDQDVMQTNEYVTGFSRLIRATLNQSAKSFISLEEELEYLTDYLALEKMRFKDKMNYFIEVDPAIDPFNIVVPPMLIQPYVENAMRHGLRNKPGGGFIRIVVRKEGTGLMISIEDNGIGRKKAMEYKTREHIEYQSKGMSMTASRINIIAAVFGVHIRVDMEDRTTHGAPDGTKVTIFIPEFSHAAF